MYISCKAKAVKSALTLLCIFVSSFAYPQWDGSAAVQSVRKELGAPFKKGGMDWENGVDGIGMIRLLAEEQGISLPNTILELYTQEGKGIKNFNNLEAGDWVFFKINGQEPITEVGLYLGKGKAVVIPNFGRKRLRIIRLSTDPIYSNAFVLGKRFGDDSSEPGNNTSSSRKSNKKKYQAPEEKSGNIKAEVKRGEQVVEFALKKIKTPYKYGGETWRGVDCSGFTMLVYKESIGVSLPHSAKGQFALTGKRIVKKEELIPGDLIFFDIAGKGQIGHVGIYIGNYEFIHAPSSGKTVGKAEIKSNPYWTPRYRGGMRFIP
ncbi:MAG: cell wall-associated NlpC family hydrolase [Sphingobacteriales bacterium]